MLDLFQIKLWIIKNKYFCLVLVTAKLGVKLMDGYAQLSLEQKFKLKVLQEQVQDLSREQAQEYLLEMFRQMMVKDNLVKQLLKNA